MTSAMEIADHDSGYRVELDAYAGPLDLLLYLVKRHEIDLSDVPVAELTQQYLRHLEVIKAIDVDRAGEFLVMAATLLEIKSQMLVPRPEGEGDAAGGDGERPDQAIDPRFELVQQLLAYKRFKDAAIALEKREHEWARRYAAHPVKVPRQQASAGPDDPDNAEPIELDLEDVHVLDLCEAFARMLESIGQHKLEHQVTYDDTPISLHAADIYDRLVRDGAMSLQKMFEGRHTRSEMVGLFLATLELVRQRKVRVVQDEAAVGGDIRLEARPEHEQTDTPDDAPRDWRNPETGEVEYDWPDERSRRRAERRANIRAARAAQGELEDVPMIEAMDEDDEVDNEDDD
jgi:segregation and condensation protein A